MKENFKNSKRLINSLSDRDSFYLYYCSGWKRVLSVCFCFITFTGISQSKAISYLAKKINYFWQSAEEINLLDYSQHSAVWRKSLGHCRKVTILKGHSVLLFLPYSFEQLAANWILNRHRFYRHLLLFSILIKCRLKLNPFYCRP